MPELPEVEVTRRGLMDLVGHRLCSVIVGDEKLLGEGLDNEYSGELLSSYSVCSIVRRGKYCLFDLGEETLLFSLRMTGNLTAGKSVVNDRDSHVTFQLDEGVLVFSSVRRFSRVHRYETTNLESIPKIKKLGLDPFHDQFSIDTLIPELESRTAPIKTLLMNQEVVAGLGNIYANEACHAAEIDPTRSVRTLEDNELARLIEEIVDVLETAVELGGSTLNDFRGPKGQDGEFQDNFYVYDRAGKKCVHCDNEIQKTVLAGRSTFFCPNCQ